MKNTGIATQRVAGLCIAAGLGLCLTQACKRNTDTQKATGSADDASERAAISALQRTLAELSPAEAQPPSDAQKRLAAAVDNHFRNAQSQRHYLHLDKPLYRPGETIWYRVFELQTSTLTTGQGGGGILVSLINPRGASVRQKRLQVTNGVATNDFIIPEEAEGGEYILRVNSERGATWERSVIVSQYQPPRIKKKAEFLRKAYGAGDSVAAAVSLSRATGEALSNHNASAVVVIDQVEVARVPFMTDEKGNAVVKFDLPKSFAKGDGLLTVLVNDGGVTESLQKRIPIIMKELKFELFPEGGQLVTELPGRVYFMAKNLIDKPADVEGRVVDDTGSEVATLRSFHNGLGRFDLTPQKGRSYRVEITKPAGIEQTIDVPAALETGCVLQSVDDFSSERSDLRIGVFCSEAREVIATAVLLEKKLGEQLISVPANNATVLSFSIPRGSQGAVRVTLFDSELSPLAERLVYRGRGQDLTVSITANRRSYAPRDSVSLMVETKDLAGRPVQADLSLAVVDDTVLSFADDKTAHFLARTYLEAEMPGQEIEEPNFYFSDDAKAAAGLDLVLGTQGWRRFEWRQVLGPTGGSGDGFGAEKNEMPVDVAMAEPEVQEMAPPPRAAPPAEPIEKGNKQPKALARPARQIAAKPEAKKDMAAGRAAGKLGRMRAEALADLATGGDDKALGGWAGEAAMENEDRRVYFAPVRVYPAPNYAGTYDGPRTDFRETIHWEPSVKTDKNGKAEVSFYLSDAITSFRATAEGVSLGGLPGRSDTLVQSKLPVSLVVKMPLEVSAGDFVRLPVTLQNETDREYTVAIESEFGTAYRVKGGIPKTVKLKANERKAFFAELKVIGHGSNPEDGRMRVAMATSNLKDEVSRQIKVVPLGFPKELSLAGTVKDKAEHTVNLAGALPGSIEASLTMYPSPLATMIKGTESMIREPSGCFEQASSANYPNIMILGYLEQHDSVDPELVARTQGMLDRGYKKLVGYESPKKGYEWFGGDPGHEALTAYGLMEFADMAPVYGDVDNSMIKRTAAWLKTRRDGKGGFKKNPRALDSFGRASDDVTSAYITYALSEAGEKDLSAELKRQKSIARSTKDPYLLALASNTMATLENDAGSTVAAFGRLAKMQSEDGAWQGADHSITRSGGNALTIETTALAVMALLKGGERYATNVRRGIEWMNKNRSGSGGFSSTQSTILSLRAMTEYARASRKTDAPGVATLFVNGKQAGKMRYQKGRTEPLVFDNAVEFLTAGENRIEVRLDSKTALPYSMAISYRSEKPAADAETQVTLQTSLAKEKVPMGEGVRMDVTVQNKASEGIPMTLARVGIPGGLTFQTWQLKELVDKKVIDFYETKEREVVLYFRSLGPNAVKDVPLELIARVPGQYTAPASRAYLYYTDEFKHWVEPVKVTVEQ